MVNPKRRFRDFDAPVKSGRHDPVVEAITQQFDLQAPGVGIGLMRLAKMRSWGVVITPEVAVNCIADHVRIAESNLRRLWSPQAPPEGGHEPIVYYMRLGNRVKIGYTTNLASRRQAITPEEVLAVEDGGPALERQRHGQFAALRTSGEWFRYEDALVEWVAFLRGEGTISLRSG